MQKAPQTAGSEIAALLQAYIESDPRLTIWRHYPDISDADDDYTDRWACQEVSSEFVAFARSRGWNAALVHAEDPDEGFAFDHFWARLTGPGFIADIDWTARQYHNLHELDGHDETVLSLPWPLRWDPAAAGNSSHPVVGGYAQLTVIED